MSECNGSEHVFVQPDKLGRCQCRRWLIAVAVEEPKSAFVSHDTYRALDKRFGPDVPKGALFLAGLPMEVDSSLPKNVVEIRNERGDVLERREL